MSFSASPENVLRYDQPQGDGILSENDQKLMTQWFDTLETEPTPNMMDIAPNASASGLTYPETSSQNVMQFPAGFPPAYGGFDQTFNGTPAGYVYPMSHGAVGMPAAESFAQQSNFQTISSMHHSPYSPYQMPLAGLQSPSMQLVPKSKLSENHRNVVYVKSEPTVPSRRPRSPSPAPSASSSRQTPKRTPSRRKSVKESSSSSSSSGNRTQSPTGKEDAIQPPTTSNAEGPSTSSAASATGGSGEAAPSASTSSSATAANVVTSSSSPAENDPASRATDSSESTSSSQQQQSQQQASRPTNRGGRGKKGHELLTEAEKKANHIASEQKRRQNIRQGFDQLVDIVPTLSQCHRSEALILQKSVEYIQQLLMQKNELKDRVKTLQVSLGDVLDHLDDSDSEGDLDIMF